MGDLNLQRECEDYERRWDEEEDSNSFHIGCCDYSTRPATIFAIEAARALCGTNNDLAIDLLRLALDELTEKEAACCRSRSRSV